jgi:DNA-binding CsgD family transcriptional regulator
MAVVGRDEELAAIEALLTARSGGLLLAGEPGIGKTVLWEVGVRRAHDDGWRVLAHRSAQAEAGLSFAGLSDLVAPVFDEVADALVAPRRRALEVALLLAEPGDTPPDTRMLGLALLDVLRALAEAAPVLVALDDAQWLDASSAAVVAIALRRLGDAPVAVLATQRTPAAEPFDGDFTRIDLPPLDLAATDRLLRDGLGRELERPVLAAVHRASGGNPFFATELARAGADGVLVPPSLRELLGGRIERLPKATQDVLLDAAALARPTVDLLAGELDALDLAVVDGLVLVEGSDVRFAHPLLASIAYDRSPPGKRRAVHARLGDRVRDPEERARHRALAAGDVPDRALAAELEEAGRHAAARGAPRAAAELIEMAVRQTPPDEIDAHRARRREAAELLHLAGDIERAAALCAELAAELPPGRERAELLYAQATTQFGDAATRLALCRQALEELGDDDALASRALGYIAINRWLSGDIRGGVVDARAGLARAERTGDERLIATAIARLVPLETWVMDVTPGIVERGADIERRLPEPLHFGSSPLFALLLRHTLGDRLEEARALRDERVAAAERRGDELTKGWYHVESINIEWHAARYQVAMQHAEVVMALADQTGEINLGAIGSAFAAQVLVDLGRDDEADATLARSEELCAAMGDRDTPTLLAGARGRRALSRGDLREAHAALDGIPEAMIEMGHLNPGATGWPDAIEALVGLGELDRASGLQVTFEDLAERSSRWARATAARCRGLLLLAQDRDEAAVAAFERSLEEEDGTYPLERGRTLLALGTAHRHARHSRLARETLERAVALFQAIGAAAWREKAQAELGRVSGRRAHGGGLTPAERRVAELAAQGRQNKEIAATLFLGVSTVEMHLSRTYRKLGVRSRTELANALVGGDAT